MNAFRSIRERLRVSQAEIGAALEVSQSNVSFYEKNQTVPPAVAAKLIAFAADRGLAISFDHVYGAAELPAEAPPADEAPPARQSAAQELGASEPSEAPAAGEYGRRADDAPLDDFKRRDHEQAQSIARAAGLKRRAADRGRDGPGARDEPHRGRGHAGANNRERHPS
jgi:putative transcriptional regulator